MIQFFMPSEIRSTKEYVDAGKKGVTMGFNALKYDVDEAAIQINMTAITGQQALVSYKEWKNRLLQQGKQ